MRGFLNFALVLAMIIVLFWFSVSSTQNAFMLEKMKDELLAAENAQKERTMLENGVDNIVHAKLDEELTIGNYNVALAQTEINSALAAYLKGKANTGTIFHENLGEATTEYLNENTSVQLLKTEGVAYAEYTYSSTMLKNTLVEKKLGNQITSYFEIPIGYTLRELRPA